MTIVTLETPRLIMTQLCEDDWPFFLRLHRAPEILRFISDHQSDDELRGRFDSRIGSWSKESEQHLCLTVQERESGNKIGIYMLMPNWQRYEQAALGYLFFPASQGRGYAIEATRSVIEFAFVTCGYHKLVASVTAGNEASIKLLNKAGFVQEGCLRDNYKLAGNWYDDLKFGLLETDRQ